jgi:hypothetical protein
VYFVTQGPTDVPAPVLAQLGNRVQHALRAHTPDDEANLRKTVRTFPKTAHYDVAETRRLAPICSWVDQEFVARLEQGCH